MKLTTKTVLQNGWSKDSIQRLLRQDDRAVERALVKIYWRQTAAEQSLLHSTESDGRGFNRSDTAFLTQVAQDCLRYNGLTGPQLARVRPRMMKYWRQLLEIAVTSPVRPENSKRLKAIAYRSASRGV